jgi:hypothetical protein
MHKSYIISCRVLWREICHFASVSSNVFDFCFLKQGLHNTPDILREQVQRAIDEVDGDYEAILVGYGLCSNGLEGIVARNTQLVTMRGHDCITFLLGSKERYRDYFDRHPGTYWYSPGWIDETLMPSKERYERTLRSYTEKYGEDNAQYLMEMEQGWFKEYTTAAYVDLGFYDTKRYKDYTQECAEWLDWKCDILTGDPTLIVDWLNGNWDPDRFLIVSPGSAAVASYDERVLDTRAHDGAQVNLSDTANPMDRSE